MLSPVCQRGMLTLACLLALAHRFADILKHSFADILKIAPIMTRPDGLVKQTTYYPCVEVPRRGRLELIGEQTLPLFQLHERW